MYALTDLPEQIANKVTVDAASGCWLWTSTIDSEGYGQTTLHRRTVKAHRLTFQLLADPSLPLNPGHSVAAAHLDHLCRVRRCVNPEHLEVVNCRENTMRGQRGVLGDHSSRFFGVHWDATRERKWIAQIKVDRRTYRLGAFLDEFAAAVAYDNAAEHYYDERTNERLGLLDSGLDHDALLAEDASRVADLRGLTSRFRGIHWSADLRRWRAQIAVGKRNRHLGYFVSEVAAAISYDNAAEALGRGRTNEERGLFDEHEFDDEAAS